MGLLWAEVSVPCLRAGRFVWGVIQLHGRAAPSKARKSPSVQGCWLQDPAEPTQRERWVETWPESADGGGRRGGPIAPALAGLERVRPPVGDRDARRQLTCRHTMIIRTHWSGYGHTKSQGPCVVGVLSVIGRKRPRGEGCKSLHFVGDILSSVMALVTSVLTGYNPEPKL